MSFPESNDPPQENSPSNNELAAQKEQILKQILSSEARMRLNNIKMVKPELSDLVEQYLIGMATQGKIPGQLSDDQLKQILLSKTLIQMLMVLLHVFSLQFLLALMTVNFLLACQDQLQFLQEEFL